MNQVIETILQHRSIRKFEDRPLSDEQIRTIVECAQAASTSSFIQAKTSFQQGCLFDWAS
jgi:FMN reductase (NADPH)